MHKPVEGTICGKTFSRRFQLTTHRKECGHEQKIPAKQAMAEALGLEDSFEQEEGNGGPSAGKRAKKKKARSAKSSSNPATTNQSTRPTPLVYDGVVSISGFDYPSSSPAARTPYQRGPL